MKQITFKIFAAGVLLLGMQLTACKSKSNTGETTTSAASVDTSMNTSVSPAPVQMAPNDSLKTGITDAIKDFPGVDASVNNGEITLTGNITRDKLPRLMMAVNSLHPKKITNNLTIK